MAKLTRKLSQVGQEALERLESLKHEDRDFSIAEAKLKRALARIHAKE